MLRTTNGGTTWTNQSSGTKSNLYGVSFTNDNTGTVVGDDGTILHILPLSALSVLPTFLNVAATANNTAIFGINSNISWNLVSGQTWLTVNKTSGSDDAAIIVTALANLDTF